MIFLTLQKSFRDRKKEKKKAVAKTKPTGHPELREPKKGRQGAEVTRDNAMHFISASSCY